MHWLLSEGLASFLVGGVVGSVPFIVLFFIAMKLEKRKQKT